MLLSPIWGLYWLMSVAHMEREREMMVISCCCRRRSCFCCCRCCCCCVICCVSFFLLLLATCTAGHGRRVTLNMDKGPCNSSSSRFLQEKKESLPVLQGNNKGGGSERAPPPPLPPPYTTTSHSSFFIRISLTNNVFRVKRGLLFLIAQWMKVSISILIFFWAFLGADITDAYIRKRDDDCYHH